MELQAALSKTKKEIYLSAFESFEQSANRKTPSWIHQTRRSAIARFSDLGFPTMREESWKYTNVSPIAETPFKSVFDSASQGLSLQKIEPFLFGQNNWQRLVFVNGIYSKEFSSVAVSKNGLKIGNLEPILTSDSKLIEPYLTRYASYDRSAFTALNTAFLRDGAFIYLPEGKVVEEPIHLLFISAPQGQSIVTYPRILIIAERNSKATIVESYVTLHPPPPKMVGDKEEGVYFTNAVTEIVLAEGAVVDHYKIQKESENAFHIGTTQVHQARDSKFSSSSISIGASLARNNLNVILDQEGAECELNGLYLTDGKQHVDNTTLIDHSKPCGKSRQIYKGIIGGKATAVFSGKIFVHKNSKRTDAEQTNKNLLLSEEATVDTKPQLEILNDDVKCTHGAAVGQLDEEAVFYLKTRGIDEEAARRLLSYGFANEVIERIKVEPLRAEMNRELLAKLEKLSVVRR